MSSRKNRNNILLFAVIAILLLLVLNAYLLYDKFTKDQIIEQTEQELVKTKELQADLETEYYKALTDLEQLRSDNTELNEMIDESKQLIAEQKNRIDKLIASGADTKELKQAIADLKADAADQVTELQKLREENKRLRAFNDTLTREKQELRRNLNTERIQKDSLAAVGQVVQEQRDKLKEDNVELATKVNKASAIDVQNIEIKSYDIRENGNLKRRRRAENVRLIEVCFETTVNEVADVGTEQFLIRIINPTGETMAVESLGSGIFTEQANSSKVRYTKSTRMRYDREPSAGCVQWTPPTAFSEGIYEVEIYNKGYLVGKETLKLR